SRILVLKKSQARVQHSPRRDCAERRAEEIGYPGRHCYSTNQGKAASARQRGANHRVIAAVLTTLYPRVVAAWVRWPINAHYRRARGGCYMQRAGIVAYE